MQLISPFETGQLNVYYLKRVWSYFNMKKQGHGDEISSNEEWQYVNALFNTLGIGMEPTIQYIFSHNPTFTEFESWIIKHGTVSKSIIEYFNTIIKYKGSATEENIPNVLNSDQLAHFQQEGYTIIKDAIPKEDCKKTVDLIYDFLDADENTPASWYTPHSAKQGIMVQLFNHELLDKNRLSEKIKGAFQQLWKRKDLLVSMDRVSFNPPETDQYQFQGPNLHWDVSLKRPIPFGLQGLLYLSDTEADQGAFTVVPGFHNKLENWLENLPQDAHPRKQDLYKLGTRPIAGKAGDFIIWHHSLPHGSCPNTSKYPRIVQYINYQPINQKGHDQWI